jgi:hypothetical protein
MPEDTRYRVEFSGERTSHCMRAHAHEDKKLATNDCAHKAIAAKKALK